MAVEFVVDPILILSYYCKEWIQLTTRGKALSRNLCKDPATVSAGTKTRDPGSGTPSPLTDTARYDWHSEIFSQGSISLTNIMLSHTRAPVLPSECC